MAAMQTLARFVGTVPHLFWKLVDCQVFIRLGVEFRLKMAEIPRLAENVLDYQ